MHFANWMFLNFFHRKTRVSLFPKFLWSLLMDFLVCWVHSLVRTAAIRMCMLVGTVVLCNLVFLRVSLDSVMARCQVSHWAEIQSKTDVCVVWIVVLLLWVLFIAVGNKHDFYTCQALEMWQNLLSKVSPLSTSLLMLMHVCVCVISFPCTIKSDSSAAALVTKPPKASDNPQPPPGAGLDAGYLGSKWSS